MNNQMVQYRKYKVPPDPLEREAKVSEMTATNRFRRQRAIEYYQKLIRDATDATKPLPVKGLRGPYLQSPAFRTAWTHALTVRLNELLNGEIDAKIDDLFVEEFHRWMLGKSKWNTIPAKTPWGTHPLVGPSIVLYEREFISKKKDFEKKLVQLKVTGPPNNIEHAWLYFKYIVTESDPDGMEYLPEWNWWTNPDEQRREPNVTYVQDLGGNLVPIHRDGPPEAGAPGPALHRESMAEVLQVNNPDPNSDGVPVPAENAQEAVERNVPFETPGRSSGSGGPPPPPPHPPKRQTTERMSSFLNSHQFFPGVPPSHGSNPKMEERANRVFRRNSSIPMYAPAGPLPASAVPYEPRSGEIHNQIHQRAQEEQNLESAGSYNYKQHAPSNINESVSDLESQMSAIDALFRGSGRNPPVRVGTQVRANASAAKAIADSLASVNPRDERKNRELQEQIEVVTRSMVDDQAQTRALLELENINPENAREIELYNGLQQLSKIEDRLMKNLDEVASTLRKFNRSGEPQLVERMENQNEVRREELRKSLERLHRLRHTLINNLHEHFLGVVSSSAEDIESLRLEDKGQIQNLEKSVKHMKKLINRYAVIASDRSKERNAVEAQKAKLLADLEREGKLNNKLLVQNENLRNASQRRHEDDQRKILDLLNQLNLERTIREQTVQQGVNNLEEMVNRQENFRGQLETQQNENRQLRERLASGNEPINELANLQESEAHNEELQRDNEALALELVENTNRYLSDSSRNDEEYRRRNIEIIQAINKTLPAELKIPIKFGDYNEIIDIIESRQLPTNSAVNDAINDMIMLELQPNPQVPEIKNPKAEVVVISDEEEEEPAPNIGFDENAFEEFNRQAEAPVQGPNENTPPGSPQRSTRSSVQYSEANAAKLLGSYTNMTAEEREEDIANLYGHPKPRKGESFSVSEGELQEIEEGLSSSFGDVYATHRKRRIEKLKKDPNGFYHAYPVFKLNAPPAANRRPTTEEVDFSIRTGYNYAEAHSLLKYASHHPAKRGQVVESFFPGALEQKRIFQYLESRRLKK